METSFGQGRYRIVTVRRDAEWIAHAEWTDSGDRFGIECAAADEAAALNRLTLWLAWQSEHTDALDALQQAERAYHRTIAGSAFASRAESSTAIELLRESLAALDAARVRLDEVRARRPE